MDSAARECGFEGGVPMMETDETDWVNLGSIESIPLGQGRAFVVAGAEIAVFRTRQGLLRAIENRCPHKQGPLADGIIGADRVVCPLHAHRFSLTTGEGSEPHECVRAFPVTARGDEIYLYPGSLEGI
jgi:nitrite reductase (NADH) small subunit